MLFLIFIIIGNCAWLSIIGSHIVELYLTPLNNFVQNIAKMTSFCNFIENV